jgi:hypothetical protein
MMEQAYWLGRKRASAANARGAGSAEARLAHLDLAGRYSVKAAAAAAAALAAAAPRPALALPVPGDPGGPPRGDPA